MHLLLLCLYNTNKFNRIYNLNTNIQDAVIDKEIYNINDKDDTKYKRAW